VAKALLTPPLSPPPPNPSPAFGGGKGGGPRSGGVRGDEGRAETIPEPTIRYYPETDTMGIEIRPWPDTTHGNADEIGGQDAGEDLAITPRRTDSPGCD